MAAPCEAAGFLVAGTTLRRAGLYTSSQNCQRFFVTKLTKNERLRTLPRTPGGSFDTHSFEHLYSAPCAQVINFGQVAQLVEQQTENLRVGGSIPSLAIADERRKKGDHGGRPFFLGFWVSGPPSLGGFSPVGFFLRGCAARLGF